MRPIRCCLRMLCLTMLGVAAFLVGCDGGPSPADPNRKGSDDRSAEAAVRELIEALGTQGEVTLVQFASAGESRGEVNLRRLDRIARNKAVPDLQVGRVELGLRPELVEGYFGRKGIEVPVVARHADRYARALGVDGSPAVVLLDAGGNVHYRGAMPGEHVLKKWTDQLQAQPPGVPGKLLRAAEVDRSLLDATKLPSLEYADKQTLRSFMGEAGLVVVFVDTTCEFSGTALADVQGVSNELGGFGVPLVVVNIGNRTEEVIDYYDKVHLHVPVLYDTSNATRDRWRLRRVPKVTYFRPDGMMTYRGNAVWDDLAAGMAADLGVEADEIRFEQEGTSYG